MFALIVVILTVLLFIVAQKIHAKYTYVLLLPIITCTVVTIIILLAFNIPYSRYMEGGSYIQKMLGPAVVALAYPLYNQRQLIMKYKVSIISSLFVAMITGLLSVTAILKLSNASDQFLNTALPKSLTTPIAMQVSDAIGGIAPLTAVLVMLAGVTGAVFGPYIYKIGRIHTPISRGVSMGSASHGVGIAKLKEYGEEDLSMGSLSMGLSAVLGAIVVPLFALFI